ncbi:TBC1 domain family member 2B-like [Pongo pygmaeus]|uniref:TBC1 domain family member 2B-like n=1 Tax=Pongo pygmaeus TaxID=9600 RepID=UPI00300CAD7B
MLSSTESPEGGAGRRGGGAAGAGSAAAAARRRGGRGTNGWRTGSHTGAGARAEEGSDGEGEAAEPGAGTAREPARLRGYRSRRFVLDAHRCCLCYFKNPHDPLPLGHLDRAEACFSYQRADEAAEQPAHFQVRSAGAATVLEDLALLPRLECSGVISANCNLDAWAQVILPPEPPE